MTEEMLKEFGEQPQNSLKILSEVVKKAPTLVDHYQEIRRKHAPTGDHVMRVTKTMIDVAIELGLNPHFAGIVGLGHDSGKALIPEPSRTEMYISDERQNGAYINISEHMENSREIINSLPDTELSQTEKADVLAVLMAHHEVLSSPPERYPRGMHAKKTEKVLRREITDDIFTWQIILALSDKADRAAWGVNPDEGFKSNEQVKNSLRQYFDTVRLQDERLNQRLYEFDFERYIDLVVDITTGVDIKTLDETRRILAR